MRRFAVELSMNLKSLFRDLAISSRRFAMVVLVSPTLRLSSRVSKMSETVGRSDLRSCGVPAVARSMREVNARSSLFLRLSGALP